MKKNIFNSNSSKALTVKEKKDFEILKNIMAESFKGTSVSKKMKITKSAIIFSQYC